MSFSKDQKCKCGNKTFRVAKDPIGQDNLSTYHIACALCGEHLHSYKI